MAPPNRPWEIVMLRLVAVAVLALGAGQALAADTFASQLRPFIGKPINVNEKGTYEPGLPLVSVGDDNFCVRYKMMDSDKTVPRCYLFTSVVWYSLDVDRPVIGIR